MEGTVIPPWFQLIPVELPTFGKALSFDQFFDVANIINPARDRDSNLVRGTVAACVRHEGRLRVD
jgi:hypothetical protein